jgi:lysophospholipase L1-like esterase
MAQHPFRNGEKVLFQGDSITDCGWRDPANVNTLGGGYVAMIRGLLSARFPDLKVEVINRGVGGDRTEELLDRWQEDCLALKPDWLSIKIGVNDVWRKRTEHLGGQAYIALDAYKTNYTSLLDQARAAGIKRFVLVSPTPIDDDPDTDLNELVAQYGEAVRELAQNYGAIYVPAREKLWHAIETVPNLRWTVEGCHPTTPGHAVIAQAWMDAVCGT